MVWYEYIEYYQLFCEWNESKGILAAKINDSNEGLLHMENLEKLTEIINIILIPWA